MLNFLASLIRRAPPHFDPSLITDDWFKAHFSYAAPLVLEWLRPHIDVAQSTIMDFGCGDGINNLALALQHPPRRLIGVDITRTFDDLPALARQQIGLNRLPSNMTFRQIRAGESLRGREPVDAIYSWSTFEHVETPYLDPIVEDLRDCLRPGGVMFVQIEPLYYSAWGSHLGRFIRDPWAHLLLDETQLRARIMASVDDVPDDEKEWNYFQRDFGSYKEFIFEEYLKLNRLKADELQSLMLRHGFEVLRTETRKLDLTPPVELIDRLGEDALRTNEVLLLLRKPQA